MSIIVGFASRNPGTSIPGFLLDIVRGAREFKRSSAANVDSIEHSRDAKARTSEANNEEGQS